MSDDGGQQQQTAGGPVDLSPGVTTVAFDPIIPPVRIPVRAGVNDDPSKGEWLLAFKDAESWRKGCQICHGKLSENCEMGARMGCSISAADVCRVPWWKQALVFMKVAKLDKEEQEACEEREMMACLARSKENCAKYARETCEPVFADIRIADPHVPLDPRFTGPPRRRTLSKGRKLQHENVFEGRHAEDLLAKKSRDGGANEDSESSEPDSSQATNYRGRELMDSDSMQRLWDGPARREKAVVGGNPAQTKSPIDGWEGGLIRPKLNSQTKQGGE